MRFLLRREIEGGGQDLWLPALTQEMSPAADVAQVRLLCAPTTTSC